MFNGKPRQIILLSITAALLIASGWIISCGGNSTPTGGTSAVTGAITTSLTDPPTCSASFDHVWVTVTKVTANISSTAAETDNGWVTLVDLTSAPRQLDLLSLASTTCVLTQLGSTTGLTPGDYQQIRLYLLSNTATSGPSPNNCGNNNGFNCVVPHNSAPQELLLSSEAALNNIPLVSEGTGTALTTPWATITGQVTSAGSGGATVADITLSPLQSATAGGSTVLVTVPAFAVNAQPPTVPTTATPTPSAPACPSGTDCFNYSLMVPSGNPQVGAFSSGSITYTAPAASPVTYSLNATTKIPPPSGCTTSTPSPATVSSIAVTPAATTSVNTVLAFTGCTAP